MVKKMPLLATMALAILFTAPAAAQAEAHWTHPTSGETVGARPEAAQLNMEGQVSSVVGALKTLVAVQFQAEVWNSEASGMGEGEVTNRIPGVGTVVGVPPFLDCTITTAWLGSWTLTLTTNDEEPENTDAATIDLEGVQFQTHFNTGCQAAGIPTTASAEGTLTIAAGSEPETDGLDLHFEGGDLHLSGSETPVTFESTPDPLTATGAQVEQH